MPYTLFKAIDKKKGGESDITVAKKEGRGIGISPGMLHSHEVFQLTNDLLKTFPPKCTGLL